MNPSSLVLCYIFAYAKEESSFLQKQNSSVCGCAIYSDSCRQFNGKISCMEEI